jgi:hypothetical protein
MVSHPRSLPIRSQFRREMRQRSEVLPQTATVDGLPGRLVDARGGAVNAVSVGALVQCVTLIAT